jgi:hypothetical protein
LLGVVGVLLWLRLLALTSGVKSGTPHII